MLYLLLYTNPHPHVQFSKKKKMANKYNFLIITLQKYQTG